LRGVWGFGTVTMNPAFFAHTLAGRRETAAKRIQATARDWLRGMPARRRRREENAKKRAWLVFSF
jgi:hypothetical protein